MFGKTGCSQRKSNGTVFFTGNFFPESSEYHRTFTTLCSFMRCDLLPKLYSRKDRSNVAVTQQKRGRPFLLVFNQISLKARLYGEKLSRLKGSPANPGRDTFPTFPYKTRRTIYMRNTKLARLEGDSPSSSLSFEGRVTLPAGTTFFFFI